MLDNYTKFTINQSTVNNFFNKKNLIRVKVNSFKTCLSFDVSGTIAYYWLRRWHQGDVTSNNVAVLDLPCFVTSVIVIYPNCSHIRTNRNCVWSIGNDHYGGSENVALKNEFKFFKLHRVYLQPFNLSNVSNFPGVEFLRTLSRFKERKGNFSSYVHVLHKTSH